MKSLPPSLISVMTSEYGAVWFSVVQYGAVSALKSSTVPYLHGITVASTRRTRAEHANNTDLLSTIVAYVSTHANISTVRHARKKAVLGPIAVETLRHTMLHCTAWHYTARHGTALHCMALHCTTWHCTALHYVHSAPVGSHQANRRLRPKCSVQIAAKEIARCTKPRESSTTNSDKGIWT